MTRMPAPPLWWRNPDCPLCGHEVDVVDRDEFECRLCDVSWSTHGEGRFQDLEMRQCLAEKQPFTGMGTGVEAIVYRCVRDLGHKDIWHYGIRIDLEKPDPSSDYTWRRDS